ncbi:hypothetical protein PTKIN_Ptkin11bG0065700 [Pterospermum kingtungense]
MSLMLKKYMDRMNMLLILLHLAYASVLRRWKGSAVDGKVLRDAVSRKNSLKVLKGYYYLVDAGYANCNGFLAPFRGQRYHLND